MLWEAITAARDVGRLHDIASVLVRHGFADVVGRIGLRRALERMGRLLHLPSDGHGRSDLPSPVRLRTALEELGPTFVKLGQVLATRVDLFGPPWIAEFERLQNQAPCVPFAVLEPLLEQAFGGTLAEVLGEVDPEPLAAASIAQVHRAVLHDGTQVVLKVRRPGIRETIAADLRLLERVARALEAHSPEAARYRPRQVVRYFRSSVERELDLAAECHNAERIAAALGDAAPIVIPRVHWAWTSEAVNVQDFLPGRPLRDLLDPGVAASEGADTPSIARLGAAAILQMVLVDGFFHADPHGGNVLYLPGNRLGLIDFGMVGHLPPVRRDQLVALLRGLVEQDVEQVAGVLEQWAGDASPDPDLLAEDIASFLGRYHGVPLEQIDVGGMLGHVARVVREHGLSLPPDLAMVFKVFITLEGLGRRLDPGFDMVGAAAPFLRRILRERYRPRVLAGRAMEVLGDTTDVLTQLPRLLRRLLRSGGRKGLRIELNQLPAFGIQVSTSANRLALGLVIAALIVGSSIVMTVEGGPTLFGLPLLGLAGFVGSVLGGLWLLVSILRSGGGR